MRLEKLTSSNVLAVTLSEIKDHLRIEQDELDYDTDLTQLIEAAQAYVEAETHNTLIETNFKATWSTYPCPQEGIAIPAWPVNTVLYIEYVDENGDIQVMPSDDYQVNTTQCPARVYSTHNTEWPETQEGNKVDGFSIVFAAGHASSSEGVPPMFKAMIKLLAASWFKNREAVGQKNHKVQLAFDALRDQVRVNEWQEFLKQ